MVRLGAGKYEIFNRFFAEFLIVFLSLLWLESMFLLTNCSLLKKLYKKYIYVDKNTGFHANIQIYYEFRKSLLGLEINFERKKCRKDHSDLPKFKDETN